MSSEFLKAIKKVGVLLDDDFLPVAYVDAFGARLSARTALQVVHRAVLALLTLGNLPDASTRIEHHLESAWRQSCRGRTVRVWLR